MNSSGEGRGATPPEEHRDRRTLLPLLCSLAALGLSFVGLFEIDVPLTRFVRSLNDYQIDHLRNPWLARLSDVGDRLGRGESLAVLSLILLAIGYSLRRSVWKSAGWQTLVAHGLAGLSNNLLKHLVGRARPKFMHSGKLELFPLGGSGWDSFPSGHSMASFAVAAVLAVRFPRARWVILSIAAAVAASRILRGAHFLTDTAGGAVLGVLIGMVAAHPWKDWRASLASALYGLMPVLVWLFVATWTVSHPASEQWPAPYLIGAGFAMSLIGLVGHVLLMVRPAVRSVYVTRPLARLLIGVGIGLFTGSLLVTTTVLLVCIAGWLRRESTGQDAAVEPGLGWRREAAFGLAALLTLYAMSELRGALPIL